MGRTGLSARALCEPSHILVRHILLEAPEARRSLTKFISTISIAVFIEGLVTVVRVSKQDVDKMFYPTLLLLTAIVIGLGLGLYQRLSVAGEQQDKGSKKATLQARSGSQTKG
jgi:hypothetical protein